MHLGYRTDGAAVNELVNQPPALPGRALERGILVNVTAGDVMRLFPPLNIPEDDLWPALDTLLELVKS